MHVLDLFNDKERRFLNGGPLEEANGKQRMSRAAKGNEKYGKDGMKALAKAGREGASEEKLDKIRDKHNKYDESVGSMVDKLEEACWTGYHKEGMKTMFGKQYPNCVKNKKKTTEDYTLEEIFGHQCPHCNGELISEELISEKQDACYHKVKGRYKVWPSAYASGALVQCRKKGAANWGNKSESITQEEYDQLDENLKKWFDDKWVRFGPDGKIKGDCARGSSSEGKPKCLPQSKAQALGKKGRASAGARKRRQDPDADRSGKAINVATKKKSNEGVAEAQEKFNQAVMQPGVMEVTGDKPFDNMMKTIKKGTAKQNTADRQAEKADSQQRARAAFGNMFGGGNPADKLSIRKPPVVEGDTEQKPRIRKYAKMRPDGSRAVRYEVLDYMGRRADSQGADGFDDLKNAKQFYYRNRINLIAPVDESTNDILDNNTQTEPIGMKESSRSWCKEEKRWKDNK